MEFIMFAGILILILFLFLPSALLPCTLNTLFSSCELSEMGVSLEESKNIQCVPWAGGSAI